MTGSLEHPGVIPVYGLGFFDDGRPYYAMRFIRGDSLKDAIAQFHQAEGPGRDPGERSLALRRLLRRFVDACNALAYAHSRGVLHRDLKPSNVMLGPYGETLVVDWGLAKAAGLRNGSSETDGRTLRPTSGSASTPTLTGEVIGTPAYMSPEQARGELDSLGPRSDVYSLGATLYSLLTGRPPIENDDVGEILRGVQRGDFTAPRSLAVAIDPALEAVCTKAMALRAEDRYATCRELADDVEQWMADEPVTAWREPLARRARRWARRNRTAVITLAASVLVALVGTGAVLAVQTKANVRLTQANNMLALSNQREKQRFDLALEAIKLFSGEVGDDLVLKADRFKPLRDKLLRGALEFYTKLEGLLKDQPDQGSRGAMGDAYFELGKLTSKIGDRPAALAAHNKGLAVRRELASGRGDDAEARGNVAKSLHAAATLLDETGNSVEAIARFEEACELLEGPPFSAAGSEKRRALLGMVYHGLGFVIEKTGKPGAAMTAYQRSVETLTPLAEDNPAVAEFQSWLADSHNSIGLLHWRSGKPVEAQVSYRRAVAVQQKLADDNPAVAEYQSRLAMTLHNIGILQSQAGERREALMTYRRSLAIKQKLADDNPAVTEFQNRLAVSHNGIGILQSETGKTGDGLESFLRGQAIYQKLADDNPAVTPFRNSLADSEANVGLLLVMNGRPAEAVAEFSREEAIRRRVVRENPSVPHYQYALATCQTNKATALLCLGRPAEAQALCERAAGLCGALVRDHPDIRTFRTGLWESFLRSAVARRDQGDAAGAAADSRRADALLEGAGVLDSNYTFSHACCHASLSWAAGRPGSGVSAGEADAEAAKALALLWRAVAMGYRLFASYRTETALDPLRDRPEFRLLMMDVAMPAEPFAE